MFSIQNLLKSSDCFRNWHIFTGKTGKLLCHEEWLGKETLYLTGAVDKDFFILGQLVHTKDCDDILQFLVTL